MLRSAPLSVALFGLLALLSLPVLGEEHAPAAPAPAPTATPAPAEAPAPVAAAPEVPKVETPKVEPAKSEPAKTESAKPANDKSAEKRTTRWKKMTPQQKEELRKKAENRLSERYDRLKTVEQETIKNIMAEISKLNKEERSILMAKIKQQASKERAQRKTMKDMENNKKAPAADPNAVKQH